jgi:hypothetical protein
MNDTNPIQRLANIADASVFEVVRNSMVEDESSNVFAMTPEAFDADMKQRSTILIKQESQLAIWAGATRKEYEKYIATSREENYYDQPHTNPVVLVESPNTDVCLASEKAWEYSENGRFTDGSIIGGQVLRFIFEAPAPSSEVVKQLKSMFPESELDESTGVEILQKEDEEKVKKYNEKLRRQHEKEAARYRKKSGNSYQETLDVLDTVTIDVFSATNPETLTEEVLLEISELFKSAEEREIEIETEKAMFDFATLLKKIQEKRTR